MRTNPSSAVSLNVEVENRSDETASTVKIIWLTPDRRVVHDEEKLVSLPVGGKIGIPLANSLNNIPESDYGIWHVDYALYGPDDREDQAHYFGDLDIEAWMNIISKENRAGEGGGAYPATLAFMA